MTQPPSTSPTPEELILAMLREVLARQAQQMGLSQPAVPAEPPVPVMPPAPTPAPPPVLAPPQADEATSEPTRAHPPPEAAAAGEPQVRPLTTREREALARFEARAAEPPEVTGLPAIVRWVVAGLAACLLLINLPLLGGTAVARALPDRQSLIIRDGLVLKGPGPEIYVLEDNQRRWISSLEAFAHYGYSWEDVRVVDQAFLEQFPEGRPVHVLAKCYNSPHIYRLENDQKRWIQDIPTLLAEGHVWEDVRTVNCDWLRAVPDGPPIPEEAGPPPVP